MIITFSLLVVTDRINGQQNKFKSVERPGKQRGLRTEAAVHRCYIRSVFSNNFAKFNDVVLMSLLLTLNIFITPFSIVSVIDFEQVIVSAEMGSCSKNVNQMLLYGFCKK